MSKAIRTFELELPRERAIAACRVAVADLNWELTATRSDHLAVRQDPARLCCRSAPVEVEIVLTKSGEHQTTIACRGTVAGFGPIASRDLPAALGALEAAIGRPLA